MNEVSIKDTKDCFLSFSSFKVFMLNNVVKPIQIKYKIIIEYQILCSQLLLVQPLVATN